MICIRELAARSDRARAREIDCERYIRFLSRRSAHEHVRTRSQACDHTVRSTRSPRSRPHAAALSHRRARARSLTISMCARVDERHRVDGGQPRVAAAMPITMVTTTERARMRSAVAVGGRSSTLRCVRAANRGVRVARGASGRGRRAAARKGARATGLARRVPVRVRVPRALTRCAVSAPTSCLPHSRARASRIENCARDACGSQRIGGQARARAKSFRAG